MITAKLTAEHSSFEAGVELVKGTTEASVEISGSSFNAFLNTSVRIPDHLEIEGTWNGICICGHPVSENIENMVFKCVYRNGSYSLCTPTPSPAVWQDTEGEQTVVFSYEEGGVTITASKSASVYKSKSVGGIIFYIDNTADGTYRFWDANGQEVEAPTVGTDCTGWTYIVEGASKDKYYVVHNELYTQKKWGGFDTLIGASGTAIGTGRSNTTTAIGSVADEVGSIWETIRNMRTNAVGGCDDWFVGSKDELDALRTSGAGNSATWFSSNHIWSSSEYSAYDAQSWPYYYSYWLTSYKHYYKCVCGVRAF